MIKTKYPRWALRPHQFRPPSRRAGGMGYPRRSHQCVLESSHSKFLDSQQHVELPPASMASFPHGWQMLCTTACAPETFITRKFDASSLVSFTCPFFVKHSGCRITCVVEAVSLSSGDDCAGIDVAELRSHHVGEDSHVQSQFATYRYWIRLTMDDVELSQAAPSRVLPLSMNSAKTRLHSCKQTICPSCRRPLRLTLYHQS